MSLNKIVYYIIFEVFALIITIFTTYYMWENFEIKESAQIAYSYTHKEEQLTLNLKNNLTELMPLQDKNAMKETNNITIEINNPRQIKKQYALYLIINSKSTINKKYLKINIGAENKYIKDLENFKKEQKSYYLLKNGIINKKETIKEEIHIWLTDDAPNTEQNKILDFNLYLEEM